jgi:hypothetical protein
MQEAGSQFQSEQFIVSHKRKPTPFADAKGQRLEVNPSVDRFKREMANLSAAL